MATPKRLYRSETNSVIAGVAGGLGEFFNIDPVIFRILLVLSVTAGGMGLIVYILMWIFIPTKSRLGLSAEKSIEQNVEELTSKAEQFGQEMERYFQTDSVRTCGGITLLVLGVILLTGTLGIVSIFSVWNVMWPVAIIGLGLLIIIRGR